jgi:hypothetical protein
VARLARMMLGRIAFMVRVLVGDHSLGPPLPGQVGDQIKLQQGSVCRSKEHRHGAPAQHGCEAGRLIETHVDIEDLRARFVVYLPAHALYRSGSFGHRLHSSQITVSPIIGTYTNRVSIFISPQQSHSRGPAGRMGASVYLHLH